MERALWINRTAQAKACKCKKRFCFEKRPCKEYVCGDPHLMSHWFSHIKKDIGSKRVQLQALSAKSHIRNSNCMCFLCSISATREQLCRTAEVSQSSLATSFSWAVDITYQTYTWQLGNKPAHAQSIILVVFSLHDASMEPGKQRKRCKLGEEERIN